ncbi:HNH endonuclease [Virgibacillus sp. Bac332]|uniref:HNH endonuclease n=1 Tax=Virgibacillus sp. Bac332 TaxID=2419842 RepID=UPI000EF4FD09|nr:HNH endonuclease [Virgibacillus sp. Bac332]
MPSIEYKTDQQKKSFYNSNAWRGPNGLRIQALERDNYECQQCKREGKVTTDSIQEEGKHKEIKLNVDHKYPIEFYPKLALVLENLETLCVYHHNVKEGRTMDKIRPKSKKKKWDDERW